MEAFFQSLFHYGSLVRSHPPAVSPSLDDFEMLQFLRPIPQEKPKGFQVVLNVALLEPSEVQLEVVNGKILEVRGNHGRKMNSDGLYMTRSIQYTYEIPEEMQGKTLHAEWSEDEYLLIQADPEKTAAVGEERIQIIPNRVPYTVRPTVEMGVVRDMIQDIRDKAQNALHYIRFHARSGPTEEERKIERQLEEQLSGIEVKSKKSSEENKTEPESSEESKDSKAANVKERNVLPTDDTPTSYCT